MTDRAGRLPSSRASEAGRWTVGAGTGLRQARLLRGAVEQRGPRAPSRGCPGAGDRRAAAPASLGRQWAEQQAPAPSPPPASLGRVSLRVQQRPGWAAGPVPGTRGVRGGRSRETQPGRGAAPRGCWGGLWDGPACDLPVTSVWGGTLGPGCQPQLRVEVAGKEMGMAS